MRINNLKIQCVTPHKLHFVDHVATKKKSLFFYCPRSFFTYFLSREILLIRMSYDMELRPSAQEAVKRLSSGFSLSENSHHAMSAKDDKSLKLATFSLQGYLKVGFLHASHHTHVD